MEPITDTGGSIAADARSTLTRGDLDEIRGRETAGRSDVPRDIGEVQALTNRLIGQADQLHELVDGLERRFHTVLRNPEADPGRPTIETDARTPLVEQLSGASLRFGDAFNRIVGILDRCEL